MKASLWHDAAEQEDNEYEEYREIKECEESCAHFDGLNQCCWLITQNTPGLCTDVHEGDYCIHGFKEDE